MAGFWKVTCRRALMHDPTDIELRYYLECYRAGYERGVADVAKALVLEDWSPLTWGIAISMATDRSVIEAGCWLAGMRTGRTDQLAGRADPVTRMLHKFSEQWESDYISDCALECNPVGMKLRRLLAAFFSRQKTQPIKDRLGGELWS